MWSQIVLTSLAKHAVRSGLDNGVPSEQLDFEQH